MAEPEEDQGNQGEGPQGAAEAAQGDSGEAVTPSYSLLGLSAAVYSNPLLPKSAKNLSSGARIQAKTGRLPKVNPNFGKRYISIQAYNALALNDTYNFTSIGTDRGLQIRVTKKPSNGSGWDEVIDVKDVTPYDPAQWTISEGVPNSSQALTITSTSTYFHLDYNKDAFHANAGYYQYQSANGVYEVTIQVTFASGHIETFDIPCPVYYQYQADLSYDENPSETVGQIQEVHQCTTDANEEFYSKGPNQLMSPHYAGSQTYVVTRFAPDPSFNPSGTLGEYGYVSPILIPGIDRFNLINPIDNPWGDFLTPFYGSNGFTTVDQTQTSKQVIKRIDAVAQINNPDHTSLIDTKDYSWFQTFYTHDPNTNAYHNGTFSGTGDTSYSQILTDIIANNHINAQYFTSTFYYSENITSCIVTTGPQYRVCDNPGNPSHYATTGNDCSGTAIPAADLPGGSNFSNVTYTHDQSCCTKCTLTVSATTVDATNGVNDGKIVWDATSGGVSSGNPWNSGSEYTVTLEDSNGNVMGTAAPTGGNTFTDSTCDTVNNSSLVACNSSVKIQPGMQVSGTGIPTTPPTYVGAITIGSVSVDVTQFQLVDTLGNIVDANASNTDETLTFAIGHTGEHGGLAPNNTANPFYTLCITDEDGCQECNSLVVNENPIVTTTGCTDSTAVNYDSTATIDDGSCVLCNSTTGELVDPISGSSTPSWTYADSNGPATVNNISTPSWNSDGTLSVAGTPTLTTYLTFDANSSFEIKLYKVINQGDTSTSNGASLIATQNAGTLNNVSVAAHTFTGLAYGWYSVRFRYIDSNSVSTMEDCWSEFPTLVPAEVCSDPANPNYTVIPSNPLLRFPNNQVVCASQPPACCNLHPVNTNWVDQKDPCSEMYLSSETDCDPGRVVDVEWLFSPTGSTYTSLGTYSLGNVSGGSGDFYAYSNNDQVNGVNWLTSNGTGYYKVKITATHGTPGANANVCVREEFALITLPIVGCMDPAAHNFDPTATCPGPCAFPSWDCDPNTGNCIDPWQGTLQGYTPGAYNCLTGPGCCNSYCSPVNVGGCTDSCATNFDPNATFDDGSCTYTACLHWPSTNQYQNCCNNNYYPPSQIIAADNSCCIMPCHTAHTISFTTTDSTSTCTTFNTDGSVSVTVVLNFASTSTWTWEIFENNQTTLVYTDPVTYSGSTTSNVYAQLGNGNYWAVVTDNYGCHFGMAFTINSTSPLVGCTDPNADNYNPLAVCDCCCQVQGCLDPNASNFNPNANIPGQCDYILPPPSPCIPQTIDRDKELVKACLIKEGTEWLNDYKVGRADDCTLMNKWKLILINYLLDQDGLSCLYNCQDLETPNPTIAQNCNDIWRTGGPSTGLNHNTNHTAASIVNAGEGTTVTAYDNFPNGWFGVSALSNPTNNFTYVGDVIKFDLPTGHPLASWLNGTIWTLTTPSSFPSGIHNGCSTQKIQHYTQCLDMNTISITTTINYYDNFINFVNKFCADCNISIIK